MKKRQAVVLIHGIGEQLPTETTRKFVRAVCPSEKTSVDNDGSPYIVRSGPDRKSKNFELIRIRAESSTGKQTDFYEFYWADLIAETKLSKVYKWIGRILKKWPYRATTSVKLAWILSWSILIIFNVASVIVFLGLDKGAMSEMIGLNSFVTAALVATTPFILTYITESVVLPVIGDAAKYLSAAPYNVRSRHEVRERGSALLRSLIDDNNYERVIVVGHSLGSVIGYDILKSIWHEYNTKIPKAENPSFIELKKLESLARNFESIYDFQCHQKRYFNEMKANGNPWCISDFITIGSPLSAGSWLISSSEKEFDERVRGRELPVCPPNATENKKLGEFSYFHEASKSWLPDHAALFSSVRWTNIFSPSKLIFKGDLVGGRVSHIFGKGINEVTVPIDRKLGILTHTSYWTLYKKDINSKHLCLLRAALNLEYQ